MKVHTAMADGKVSPKTIAAAALPFAGTVIAVLVQYIVTGELDHAELVTAITGLSGSVVAGLGAWLAQPGPSVATAPLGSDQAIREEVRYADVPRDLDEGAGPDRGDLPTAKSEKARVERVRRERRSR